MSYRFNATKKGRRSVCDEVERERAERSLVRMASIPVYSGAQRAAISECLSMLFDTNGWKCVFTEWLAWLEADQTRVLSRGQAKLVFGILRKLKRGAQPTEPSSTPADPSIPSKWGTMKQSWAPFLRDPSLLPKRPPQRKVEE